MKGMSEQQPSADGGAGDRIAEIRARAEAATPGEWRWEAAVYQPREGAPSDVIYSPELVTGGRWIVTTTDITEIPQPPFGPHDVTEPIQLPALMTTQADAEFIAHSRADIPYLLAHIDRLTDDLEAAREREARAKESAWFMRCGLAGPWVALGDRYYTVDAATVDEFDRQLVDQEPRP